MNHWYDVAEKWTLEGEELIAWTKRQMRLIKSPGLEENFIKMGCDNGNIWSKILYERVGLWSSVITLPSASLRSSIIAALKGALGDYLNVEISDGKLILTILGDDLRKKFNLYKASLMRDKIRKRVRSWRQDKILKLNGMLKLGLSKMYRPMAMDLLGNLTNKIAETLD